MKKLIYILFLFFSLIGYSQTYVESIIQTPYSSNPALTRSTLFYLPSDYVTSGKTYRLFIFYHGAGESLPGTPAGSTLYNSAQAGGPNPYLHNNTMPITFHDPITGEDFTYIFASPFSGNGWSTTGDESQYLKTYLVNNYRIDPARIVISGISAGGATTVEDCAYLNPNEDGVSSVPRSYKAACTIPMSEASNAIQQSWSDRAVPDSARHYGHGNFADTHGAITSDWMNYLNFSYKTNIYTVFHQYTQTPAHGEWQLFYIPTFKFSMTFKGWDHINYTGSYSIYEWAAFSKRTGVSSSITANAGGNQNITLPVNSVTLTGSGNPSTGHTITGYTWTKTSGPSSGTITSPSSASTTITGYSLAGTYVYQLQVSDNAPSSATSSVTITVNAATTNHPPPSVTVSADQNINFSTTNITSVPSYTGTLASSIWTPFPINQPPMKVGVLGSSTWVGGGTSSEDSSVWNRLITYWTAMGIINSSINLANTGSDIGAAYETGATPPTGLSAPDPLRNVTALIAAGGVKVCIVAFPTNAYDNVALTPTIIAQAHQHIYDYLTSRGIQVYITTSQSRVDFSQSVQDKLKVIRDTLLNRFGYHCMDFYTGLTTPGATTQLTQYAAGDNIHFNDLGHERMYEIVRATNIFRDLVTKNSTISTPTLSNTSIIVADTGQRRYNVGIMDGNGLAASAVTKVIVGVILPNCQGNKTVIKPDPTDSTQFVDGSATTYNPGDTILLNDNGKAFSNTVFVNLNGTQACPIVIMNDPSLNRAVRFRGPTTQIALGNCTHIKVTGSSIGSVQYGVDMDSYPGPWTTASEGGGYFAYVTSGRSAYIEWDHLYTRHAGIGFEVKQDGLCDTMYNKPNWTMDSITIHDCKIINTWDEGMYIGNTSPDNGATSYDPRPVDCSGVTTYPIPMRVGAIHVYNMIVDSTGRGGIQLASGNGKGMEVDHCTVTHNGWSGDDAQGTAISFGTYTAPYIHDNVVRNTYSWGIASLGGGITNTPIRIENNSVDSSGYMQYYIDPIAGTVGANTLAWPVAIEITTKPVDSLPALDSTLVNIKTNKIGKFKNIDGYFMALDDTYFRMQRNGSIICGNTTLDGVTPRTLLYNNNDNGATPINYSTSCNVIIIPPFYPHFSKSRRVKWSFKKAY